MPDSTTMCPECGKHVIVDRSTDGGVYAFHYRNPRLAVCPTSLQSVVHRA